MLYIVFFLVCVIVSISFILKRTKQKEIISKNKESEKFIRNENEHLNEKTVVCSGDTCYIINNKNLKKREKTVSNTLKRENICEGKEEKEFPFKDILIKDEKEKGDNSKEKKEEKKEEKKQITDENKEDINQDKNEMDQFIKNIPPINEKDKKYIEENLIKNNVICEEEKKARKAKENENNITKETKDISVEKETKLYNKEVLEKETEKVKENQEKMVKERNDILKDKMEKRENEEPFVDRFKDERKYYSDNCVKSDINEDSSTSDESCNSNSFESSSSENESGSMSASETGAALSDSDNEASNKDNDDDDEEEEEEEEYSSSEEDEDDELDTKGEKDELLKGKNVEEIKEIGNKYFKETDYHNAIYYYKKAIKKCKDKNTKSVLYSNRAACNVLLKNWDDVIKDCTKSINCNGNFVKSYIRRSKAYEQLEKYNDASNDLNKAITLDPSLKAIHEKTQKKLTILAEQQLNKEKEEMLGKLKDFGNMLLGKVGLSLDNFEVQKNPNNDGSFNIQFKQNK